MEMEIRSWAKTAVFPAAIPVVAFAFHTTPGCGLGGHAVDSALLSSQILLLLGMLFGGTVAVPESGATGKVRGSKLAAPENQHSPAMDDWDAPDRPADGSESYEAEDDDPNVPGRLAVLCWVFAAIFFGVVLLFQQFVPSDCVRGTFWILFY
jgi:hypothetical protein